MEHLDHRAEQKASTPPSESIPARRRLIKAGAIGTSVVLAALASRPAMAHVCKSPSAFGSMNVSRAPVLLECGLSPGYWKTHPESWPQNLPPTSKFNDVFPGGQLASPATMTLMDALDTGGGNVIMLRRKVIAALLNVKTGAAPDFLTEAEIKAMWNAASMGQPYVNSTRGINWPAAQVIAYFDSLFA